MNTNTILVVAAHPDDELLGAGATLRRHVERGDAVHCLILGTGITSRPGSDPAELEHLRQDAAAAGEKIGFATQRLDDFPDNAFDSVRLLDITQAVERSLAEVKPDVVYTHHEFDLNIDHRRTFQAVLTASRPCNTHAPRELLTFETLSSTEWQSEAGLFAPTMFVDVEQTLETKIAALSCYRSEMRPYPHPRSPEGIRLLAQWRGMQSGMRAAEAFRVIRRIER